MEKPLDLPLLRDCSHHPRGRWGSWGRLPSLPVPRRRAGPAERLSHQNSVSIFICPIFHQPFLLMAARKRRSSELVDFKGTKRGAPRRQRRARGSPRRGARSHPAGPARCLPPARGSLPPPSLQPGHAWSTARKSSLVSGSSRRAF